MIANNRRDPEIDFLKTSIKELLCEKLSYVVRDARFSFFSDEPEYKAIHYTHTNAIDNTDKLNSLLLNNNRVYVITALAEIMLEREGPKYKSRLRKRISEYEAEIILDEAIAAMPTVKIDSNHEFFLHLREEQQSKNTETPFAQIMEIRDNLIKNKKNLVHGVLKRLVDTVDNAKKQSILQYAIDALSVLLMHEINRKSVYLTLQRLDKAIDLNTHLVSQSMFKSSAGGTNAAIRVAYNNLCQIYMGLPAITMLPRN